MAPCRVCSAHLLGTPPRGYPAKYASLNPDGVPDELHCYENGHAENRSGNPRRKMCTRLFRLGA